MTHTEQRERRRIIAQEIAAGASYEETRQKFNVSITTLINACRDNGSPVRKRGRPLGRKAYTGLTSEQRLEKRQARYKDWQWQLTDSELAKIHGLSRERIRQIRCFMNLPPSNKNTQERREKRKLRGKAALLVREGKTTREAMELTGLSLQQVYQGCKEYGVRIPGQLKWSAEEKAAKFNNVDWSKPCWQIAAEVGLGIERVYQVRKFKLPLWLKEQERKFNESPGNL